MVKSLPANAGDSRGTGSNPGSGRSLGEESGNPLLFFFFCVGNPVDRGAWQPIAYGVAKESDMTEHTRNSHYAFPSADLILCAPAFSTWNVPYLFHLANSFSSF